MANKPIALITGGAQGIGYACAEALKEDGAQIVLADINAEGVEKAAKQLGDAAAYTCDMGNPDEIGQLFDKIEADHGPVSILVNNAGRIRLKVQSSICLPSMRLLPSQRLRLIAHRKVA